MVISNRFAKKSTDFQMREINNRVIVLKKIAADKI